MNEFSVTEYYKEALFNLESNLKNEGNAHNRARYAAEIDVVKRTLDALRSPWVKTSDRLPDKCDCYTMYLTTKKRNGGVWQVRGIFIKEHPELCPWWMPIPPLPEVEK